MVVDNFGVSLSRGSFWPWQPFSREKMDSAMRRQSAADQLTDVNGRVD